MAVAVAAPAKRCPRSSVLAWRPALLAVITVCLAAIVPFLPTLHGYFIADDFGPVQLLSSKPALHFLTLFTQPWTESIYGLELDELRPLVALSFQVNAAGGAASPLLYHLTNLLLHAANTCLVLALARVAGRLLWAARRSPHRVRGDAGTRGAGGVDQREERVAAESVLRGLLPTVRALAPGW